MSTAPTTATTSAVALPGTALPGAGLATSWDASALAPEDWLVGAFLASTRTPNTRQAYARDIADWRGWLTERGVGLLGASRVVVDLYARHAAEVRAHSPATVARRLSALTRLYRYAVAVELLERNPLEGVDRPRVGEDTTSTGLDRRELVALVTAAGASSARDYALVLLLGLNGLRASELCALDIGDVDTERGHRVLRIVRKGGRQATVPLAPQAVDAVQAYVAGRTAGPLFLSSRGARLDRTAVWRLVRRLATAAGMDKAGSLHPHDLRHAFVTLALDAGVALHRVQDAAGHADPRTTRRYDRARHNLDEHATYALAGSLSLPRPQRSAS